MAVTTLKLLPNEILLRIFDLLDDVPRFRAFYGLNRRFNALFFSPTRTCRLDFQSISRHDFNRIFEVYIPAVINRISSIRLSNDDETPGIIEDFRRRIPLSLLPNLRALTIAHAASAVLVREIIDECYTIPQLTHLRFEQCFMNLLATNIK